MSAGKVLKKIVFTAVAQEHHVAVKTKSVLKWLKSGHEVRVVIQGKADRFKAIEGIYTQIEKEVKGSAEIKQKIVKPDVLRFNLRPTEAATGLVVDDPESEAGRDDLSEITLNKDLLSDDFDDELEKSIQTERGKNRKK